MKNKHYEMIVAKAANMDLFVLCKNAVGEWIEQEYAETDVKFSETGFGYFLCLPQHKEACLHWLNGGHVQDWYRDEWSDCGFYDGTTPWAFDHMFMDDSAKYRIKPKKEKRWIAFGSESGNVYGAYLSEEKCKMAWPNLQIFEIEVEA